MRFKIPLELPIYILTDEEVAKQDAGIEVRDDVKYTDPTRPYYFYSVDLVSNHRADKRITILKSGGETFFAKMDANSVNQMISVINGI